MTVRGVPWETPDGRRTLDVQVTPLLSGDGVQGSCVAYEDVTHAQRVSEELERSRHHLENAYEELESTVEELETTSCCAPSRSSSHEPSGRRTTLPSRSSSVRARLTVGRRAPMSRPSAWFATVGSKGRAAAPTGRDADPQERLRHFRVFKDAACR